MRKIPMLAAACAAAALWAAAAHAQSVADVDTQRIVDADAQPQNWMSWGRTYDEQRFSPLDVINEDNVDELGLAWHYDHGTQELVEGTPLIIDGVMYVTSAWSITTALDARTGEQLWRFDPETPPEARSQACCGPVSRGLAAWNGAIIIATLDGYLISLDAETGAENWEVRTTDDTWFYTITGAPRAADGKIFIGNGGADLGARGYVSAYDADTGEFLWRFYTVPGDPSLGFENDAMRMAAETWTGEWWKAGGGGTVWDSIVYDPELDRVYIGVGNGSPWPHWLRSPEGGDNLFLASIVALEADTGEYIWHYQEVPEDSWDFTAVQPMMLVDLEIPDENGRVELRKTILHAPKNGFFYVIDRVTGELISAEKFAPSNWASHVDMETGRPVLLPTADYREEPQFITPSGGGAHTWHPMSYSPLTGLVYMDAREIWLLYSYNEDWSPEGKRPGSGFGGEVDPEVASHYRDLALDWRRSWLSAWDPVTQREMFRVQHTGAGAGGILSTAGNLLFEANHDLEFAAYRATDGELLWKTPIQTFAPAGPISYAVDGEQYIAINAGGGGGQGTADIQRSDGRMLVFKLGGTATLPPMPEQPEAASEAALAAPAPFAAPLSPEAVEGAQLYAQTCALCHGQNAVGEGVAPDLRRMTAETDDAFMDIVLRGARLDKGMANFSGIIDEPQAAAIHAYVRAQAGELAAEGHD